MQTRCVQRLIRHSAAAWLLPRSAMLTAQGRRPPGVPGSLVSAIGLVHCPCHDGAYYADGSFPCSRHLPDDSIPGEWSTREGADRTGEITCVG
jgi:hypothetical protein